MATLHLGENTSNPIANQMSIKAHYTRLRSNFSWQRIQLSAIRGRQEVIES